MATRIALTRSRAPACFTAIHRARPVAFGLLRHPWAPRDPLPLRHGAQQLQQRPYSAGDAATGAETGNVEPPDYLDEAELEIFKTIKSHLDPTSLEVQDVSGGCGSMYALDITSPKFAGLTVIKQHRLVNEILAERIKQWHGVQLKTRAP